MLTEPERAVDTRNLIAAAVCVLAGTGHALADVIVTEDVVVPAGTTLQLDDNFEYRGRLTVEAGARVQVDPGFELRIGTGGSLVVEGAPGNLAGFERSGSGRWNGIRFLPGSTGEISGASFEGFGVFGLFIDDADVTITGSSFIDGPAALPALSRRVVFIRPFSTVRIDGCEFSVFRGADGASATTDGQFGAAGGGVTMIEALGAEVLSVTNCFFAGVEAGSGGDGRFGRLGDLGETGTPGILSDDGGPGGPGGMGGAGGRGGFGGSATIVDASNVTDVFIAQNVVASMTGGAGGKGGQGGFGGTGGQGGPGGINPFGDGGRGGDGGMGGVGGTGGDGGASGEAVAFWIDDQSPSLPRTGAVVVAHNTVLDITTQPGGEAGLPGPAGLPGVFGAPGIGGFGGDDGQPGSPGTFGTPGEPGSDGFDEIARGLSIVTRGTTGLQAAAHNNIFTANPAGQSIGAVIGGGGMLDVSSNVISGFRPAVSSSTLITGRDTVITTPPVFQDPANLDFRPAIGSFLVDAGDNSLTPESLTTDIDGSPRFMDEVSTPTAGPSGRYSVDFGAYELVGDVEPEPCLADVNGDGVVSPADFSAWILAFNTESSECDQNTDGLCSPADFSAWVLNFNAGCS
ncbi:MAG: GC-type dockerin domain-anchored protein [Planctomycetota bacterium]